MTSPEIRGQEHLFTTEAQRAQRELFFARSGETTIGQKNPALRAGFLGPNGGIPNE